jgi:hypothetical protein
MQNTPPPTTTTLRGHAPPHTFQETPDNLTTTMLAPPSNPISLSLLHGLVDTSLTQDWDKVPITLHQKLYRTLLLDIITHQHKTWLNRNTIVHPTDELPKRPNPHSRPRKHTPRALPQSTSALKRKARNWNTQRSEQLKRKTMWRTGVPIPHTTPPWVHHGSACADWQSTRHLPYAGNGNGRRPATLNAWKN